MRTHLQPGTMIGSHTPVITISLDRYHKRLKNYNMKKIYFLTSFLLVCLFTIAQTNNAGRTDPEAKKVLDAVSSKFKTFKSANADFTYQVENADGKVLSTKKGTVSMKGTKYYVNFGDQEIFSDGKNVWTLDKSANEVTITTLDGSAGNLTPQKLF